jgi:hypothetical protein
LEEVVAVAVFLTRSFLFLYGLLEAECLVVFLFQVFLSVRQGVIVEFLGEVQIFVPAGKHQLFPVHLFIRVPGDDRCPFLFVERVQVLCDVTGVEFHAGEILHLVCYEKVEIRVFHLFFDRGGPRIMTKRVLWKCFILGILLLFIEAGMVQSMVRKEAEGGVVSGQYEFLNPSDWLQEEPQLIYITKKFL